MRGPLHLVPALALVLLPLAPGCDGGGAGKPGEPGPSPPRPEPGVAVRVAGVAVPTRLVDPFLPYLRSFRPHEAENALKRYILETHAIPMARALARWGREYGESRATLAGWLEELEAGRLEMAELARRQAAAYNEGRVPPGAGEPVERTRGILPAPVGRALFTTPAGEFTPPVRTHLGWHLFQVLSFRTDLVKDLDRVRFLEAVLVPGGRKQIETRKQLEAIEKGSVQVVDPAYRRIVSLFHQAPDPGEMRE